jgi:hypothetical protein
VVLVFSISYFFIKKKSKGRKLSAKKIPTCSNSALCVYKNCFSPLGTIAFAVLGHIAHENKVDVNKVLKSGQAIAFVTYPTIIAKENGLFMAVMLFTMFLCLGPRLIIQR